MERHYMLRCVSCGKLFEDSGDAFSLDCGDRHGPSLLRAFYKRRDFIVRGDLPGIFRYLDWLPVRRIIERVGRPVVYRSEGLARELGLRKLYIAFNGYWPERGALLETCSFKELEALSVCARIPVETDRSLVVSSAGNTGRAFLQVGSINRIPMLVVVPESAMPDMWMTVEKHPAVRLAVLKGGADYHDAIELGNTIGSLDGFYPEGGARNVARRDGLGTVLLSAVETMGEIPAHYFQAVGSGTGAIAAWEAATRLREDGRFGAGAMKLHLVQNEPFAVMSEAWRNGSRELAPLDAEDAKWRISLLHSRVLSNRKPPYGIAGGVFDALSDTAGRMYGVSGGESREAGELFESLEGSDIDPAAQVALAGLIRAIRERGVDPEESVLLNVTGGGAKRLAAKGLARRIEPDYVFTQEDAATADAVEGRLCAMGFSRSDT